MLKPSDQKKKVISGGGFLVYLCLSGINWHNDKPMAEGSCIE